MAFSTLTSILMIFSIFSLSAATLGVDASQRTYLSSWQCVRNNGYTFAVVRVYQSLGICDPNGPANINDAWNAGFAHVDGYIFPCYSCGNPAGQVDATINYLAAHNVRLLKEDEPRPTNLTASSVGATVGMLWLDIEEPSYWSSNTANNVNFIQAMLNQGKARGVSMGIYSSAYCWNPITGYSSQFKSYPLWYAHYDANPSFSDFTSFGGWTKPAIKQYAGDVTFCSAGFDKNFY